MNQKLLLGHYRLLHHMKRAQRRPDDLVAADLLSAHLYTAGVHDGSRLFVDLSKRWSYELDSALRSLAEKGCIEDVGEEDDDRVYRIKYDGRRIWQRRLADAADFLFRSVWVPILVSAATTLVTLGLTRLFSA